MAKATAELALPGDAAYGLLLQAFEREIDVLEAYDSEAVQKALAAGILATEDEDQVFGDASLAGWSEILDQPVEVQSVHFNPSSVENGPGIYAVVRLVELLTGEEKTRHVGGYRPVSQLLWLWKRQRFPYRCKLTEVAKAKSGQSAPLGIKRLESAEG